MTLKKKLRTSKKKKINSGMEDAKNTVLRSQSNRGIKSIINYTITKKKNSSAEISSNNPPENKFDELFFYIQMEICDESLDDYL